MGGLNETKSCATGLPRAASTRRIAVSCGKRRDAVLQGLEVAGRRHADDVGAGGEKLAELDVARPETRQGTLERARTDSQAGTLQHPADPQDEAEMRRQLGRVDQGEGALARQHEADMRAAGQVNDGAEHQAVRVVTGSVVTRPSSPNGSPRCRP